MIYRADRLDNLLPRRSHSCPASFQSNMTRLGGNVRNASTFAQAALEGVKASGAQGVMVPFSGDVKKTQAAYMAKVCGSHLGMSFPASLFIFSLPSCTGSVCPGCVGCKAAACQSCLLVIDCIHTDLPLFHTFLSLHQHHYA
jgi:hypothetical protein